MLLKKIKPSTSINKLIKLVKIRLVENRKIDASDYWESLAYIENELNRRPNSILENNIQNLISTLAQQEKNIITDVLNEAAAHLEGINPLIITGCFAAFMRLLVTNADEEWQIKAIVALKFAACSEVEQPFTLPETFAVDLLAMVRKLTKVEPNEALLEKLENAIFFLRNIKCGSKEKDKELESKLAHLAEIVTHFLLKEKIRPGSEVIIHVIDDSDD